MSPVADPVWPVVVLAAIQLIDALLCLGPVSFVRECYTAVHFPQRWWWTPPIVKFGAAGGLVAGIWTPWLGLVTGSCLVLYFVIAVTMHLRARDFGRNLFLNASGMLALCVAVTSVSFVS